MALDEAIWMTGIVEPLIGKVTLTLLCDNKAEVKIAKNLASMKRTKNIHWEFHSTNKNLQKGVITLKWVPGAEMLAECFTKALGASRAKSVDVEFYRGKERLK